MYIYIYIYVLYYIYIYFIYTIYWFSICPAIKYYLIYTICSKHVEFVLKWLNMGHKIRCSCQSDLPNEKGNFGIGIPKGSTSTTQATAKNKAIMAIWFISFQFGPSWVTQKKISWICCTFFKAIRPMWCFLYRITQWHPPPYRAAPHRLLLVFLDSWWVIWLDRLWNLAPQQNIWYILWLCQNSYWTWSSRNSG